MRIMKLFGIFFREHDDTIGYKKIDERILPPHRASVSSSAPSKRSRHKLSVDRISDPDVKRKERSYIDFLKLAGEDGEVDYLELRELLNISFKSVLSGEGETLPTSTTTQGNNILCHLYDLCCGLLNKNVDAVQKAKTELLSELRGGSFSKEICRCMVAMLDTDFSGKLGDEEFKELWDLITLWEKAFFLYDVDNSGSLSGFELRNALGAAGYRLTNHVLNILMHRYGNEKREITFDEFILCAVRLKTMIDKFQQRERQNVIIMSKDEWIQSTLYG